MNTPSQAATRRFLLCGKEGERYAFDMAQVRSIHPEDRMETLSGNVTDAPDNPQDPLIGVLPSRAGDLPVLDFRRCLRLSKQHKRGDSQQIVVLNAIQPFGLLVERLAQVTLPTTQIRPLPKLARVPETSLFRGVVLHQGEMAWIPEPSRLLSEEFEATDSTIQEQESLENFEVEASREHGSSQRLLLLPLGLTQEKERPWRYGVQLEKMVEVLEAGGGIDAPEGPSHLLGLILWRTRVLPIFDVAATLGVGHTTLDRRTRCLVLRLGREYVGIMVSGNMELLRLPAPHDPSTRPWPGRQELMRGQVELKNATLLLPDWERIFQCVSQ
jgi:chemotaxis signal transduction protein